MYPRGAESKILKISKMSLGSAACELRYASLGHLCWNKFRQNYRWVRILSDILGPKALILRP